MKSTKVYLLWIFWKKHYQGIGDQYRGETAKQNYHFLINSFACVMIAHLIKYWHVCVGTHVCKCNPTPFIDKPAATLSMVPHSKRSPSDASATDDVAFYVNNIMPNLLASLLEEKYKQRA